MDQDALERLYALDWNQIGLKLLVFARYWAKTHYFWKEGTYLPESKLPEDIATEAISAFWAGVREWNPKVDVVTQLKGAVRSMLWNLHKKKGSKLTTTEEPAFFEFHLDNKPDPAAEADSNDFYKSVFEALYEQDKVLDSDELIMIVMAYEDGAETVPEVAEKTGLTAKRIYELRRQLREMKQSVMEMLLKQKRPK